MTKICLFCHHPEDKCRWVLRHPEHLERFLCDDCAIAVAATIGLRVADEIQKLEAEMDKQGATVQ